MKSKWLILAAVLALTAIGMAVAGVTAFVLQRRHIDTQIDAELALEHEAFLTLAREQPNNRKVSI